MRILLINDTSSSPNWGARATSNALRKMISETGDHLIDTIFEDNIRAQKRPANVINKSQDLLKKLTPPIIYRPLKSTLSRARLPVSHHSIPKRWENFDPYLHHVTKDNDNLSKEIDAIDNADLIIIQGEGCIRANTLQSRMMLFLGYIAKKHFGKPIIMVNHTADFSHPELHKIARNIYPLFDDVVFREPTSAQKCREFCEGKIGADAAFIFEPVKMSNWLPVANRETYFDFWPHKASFNPKKPYICIGGGSGLPSKNSNSFDPVEKLSVFINIIQERFPHQLVLTASGPTDLWIFQSLAKRHNLPLIGTRIPIQQAVDIMGNAAAYIGGRWHPSIFALSGGTPIIPFSANTFKMEALTKLFDLSDFTIDPINIDNKRKQIVQLLTHYLDEGEVLRKKLRNLAREESKKAYRNVDFL